MITERKLIETVSGSDISNMSLSRVAKIDGTYYTPLIESITQKIQSFDVQTEKSGTITYQGPVISFTTSSSMIGFTVSVKGIMRLQRWNSQSNLWISLASQSFSMTGHTLSGIGSYSKRGFSDEIFEGLDYKNVECRMYYEFTFSGRSILGETVYSLISFYQTFHNVPTSSDKLLSYIFKNVASEIAFTVNSSYDGYLGCKVSAKGEATYQPSIIGKTLYF